MYNVTKRLLLHHTVVGIALFEAATKVATRH